MATQNSTNSQEDLEKLVKDYQLLQEQLRISALQLDQLQNQKIDIEKAKEEVEKATGKIYLNVGNVIVESTKEKATTDLKDKASLTEARIQSTNKQYTELKNKEKSLSEKLKSMYQVGGAQ